jgi:hypothetical protein
MTHAAFVRTVVRTSSITLFGILYNCAAVLQVLPVYVYDPTFFAPAAQSRGGDGVTPRMGPHRTRFTMECVEALRQVRHGAVHRAVNAAVLAWYLRLRAAVC